MIAREKGLEPLAQIILDQTGTDPRMAAADFLDPAKEVETIEDALTGANDIIAEMINEDQQARTKLRKLYFAKAVIHSRVLAPAKRKKAQSIAIILTGGRTLPQPPPTGYWRCAAEKKKIFSIYPWHLRKMRP